MKKYHCPKCKHEVFEEVSVDVTVSFTVVNTADGLDYGEQSSADGGYVDRFQCASCGHIIEDSDGNPVDTLEDLGPVLEELGAYTDAPVSENT